MYNDLTSAEYVSDVVVAIRPNSLAFVILHSPLSSDLLLIIGDYHTGYRRGGERNGMERKQGWIGFMDSFHIIPPSSQCATLPPSLPPSLPGGGESCLLEGCRGRRMAWLTVGRSNGCGPSRVEQDTSPHELWHSLTPRG